MKLHKRLAEYDLLGCAVADRFASSPLLGDVAAIMLQQQWQANHLSRQYNPLDLFLVTSRPGGRLPWIRPLSEVVIERFCNGRTVNLTPGEDHLSTRDASDPQWAAEVDLHRVEVLLNACGPLIIDCYQNALVEYWSTPDRDGQSPWQWFAQYLQEQLQVAIVNAIDTHALTQPEAAVAHLVQAYPWSAQQAGWTNTTTLSVHSLQVDLSLGWQLDPNLVSALLIERRSDAPAQSVTMLYTPIGRLKAFGSRQQLLDVIDQQWPDRLQGLPREVYLTQASPQVFEAQALGVLHQQLRLIDTISSTYLGGERAVALGHALDRLTSMLGLCNVHEKDSNTQLFQRLPDWLRSAGEAQHLRYAEMLAAIAQAAAENKGKDWLHGVPSAEAFALDKLDQRIHAEHPFPRLDLTGLRVVNHQVTAAALPGSGVIITDQGVRVVRFTLAQLAIANLGLLQPGWVTLESHSGGSVPSWFDEQYLRRLITDVDIGATYPLALQQSLLEDPVQVAERQRLLMMHLRTQLPAQAMELHLRKQGISLEGVEAVSQALAAAPLPTSSWSVRPLGLKHSADASADLPRNTWLIEGSLPGSARCLLYRPLHAEPLLEFDDRPALFAALSTPGPLQDDVLQRLPAADRRVYAHGGFLEPHLFFSLDDTSAIPFRSPPPATISHEPPVTDLDHALYLACVSETIELFREQARSTTQTTWQRWEELGWLLLNTLLPFARGTIARAGWLVQMDIALAQVVDDRPEMTAEPISAWVFLLSNIAILLFTHAMAKLGLKYALGAPEPEITAEEKQSPPSPMVKLVEMEQDNFIGGLEFSWSRPDGRLHADQVSALARLQTSLAPIVLGAPIPSGPLRGLYVFQDTLMALVQGKVYNVAWDELLEQPRIVGTDEAAAPGPWLRQDEAGRWRLDTRLRLRGGAPLHKRLAQLKVDNASVIDDLDAQLRQDSEHARSQQAYLEKAAQLASAEAPEPILRNYLEKTQAFARFWDEHVERLAQRNERSPLRDYKLVRANALHHGLRALQSVQVTLQKLYSPKRLQILEFYKLTQEGYEPSDADEQAARQRITALSPLIDQLLDNSERIVHRMQQLKRLASRAQPSISKLLSDTEKLWPSLPNPQMWRYLRLENNTNHLALVHGLDEQASFWLDRAWANIDLAVSQHLALEQRAQVSDEAARRLLSSIALQFDAARRQLENLREYLRTPQARANLSDLQGDLFFFSRQVEQDIAEYPDAPPQASVQQLRSQLPGLIETAEHGLLLGQPRVDDENLVDIPGPDNQSTSRTYRLEHDEWVQVHDAPPAVPAPSRHKLPSLLKDSERMIASARRELDGLQSRSPTRYLPIEIEEILQHHKRQLDAQRNAIEAHLTADNQTDESSGDADAAITVKSLEDMAESLDQQAPRLRIQAALAQKPRMGELRFLLAQGQVKVRKEGARRRLAPVKGRSADFLDEYVVLHQDQPLWYAHFHYRNSDSAKTAFTAGHLKTAAQRYAKGSTTGEIHRAPITVAAAQAVFFGL